MIIGDIETARKALESISYYRLSGYSYPFRQYDRKRRTRSDQFTPETNLEQVLALYRFDERTPYDKLFKNSHGSKLDYVHSSATPSARIIPICTLHHFG